MFGFATATNIVFGRGSIARLGQLLASACERRGLRSSQRRVLLVTGSSTQRAESALEHLTSCAEVIGTVRVAGEPSTTVAEGGVELARSEGASAIVAVGGGSAIDAGKAIAALLANGGRPLDYLEVIGRGSKLNKPSVPFIAVPTTAGTGAEVTKNAVLTATEHAVKVSLRSDYMLPDVALVDSELTHTVPRDVTAATGLDALTQVLEPYVSCQANPMTDALCLEGLRRGARAIRRAYHDGTDAEAREDMALTSLFGGLALANAKLGAVHGFAGPLGGMLGAPHGTLCARLLPAVIATNVAALRGRGGRDAALERYQRVAQLVTGDPSASPEDAATWAESLCSDLAVPRLAALGLSHSDIDLACEKAARASSMRGNPLELTGAELRSILEASA